MEIKNEQSGQKQLLSRYSRYGCREERVLGVISAQSSSKTMKSYQQVMSVRRGAERIVPTSDTVQGKNLKFRAAKDTSFCRSVHAEANCIISAARRDTIGAALYLVGRDVKTGELVSNACCCSMCAKTYGDKCRYRKSHCPQHTDRIYGL